MITTGFAFRAGALALLMATAGCGGDDGGSGGIGAMCKAFTACGGDVTSTWSIAEMCGGADVGEFDADCPGSTVDTSGLKATTWGPWRGRGGRRSGRAS